MILYGEPTWIDAVLDRVASAVQAAARLPADKVFPYAGEADALLKAPPAEQFAALWYTSLQPNAAAVAGGGAAHTVLDAVLRVDLFTRLGTDRELKDARLLADRSRGFATVIRRVLTAVQVQSFAEAGRSPLTQPSRLAPGGITMNPRTPSTGWAWARLSVGCPFRADLTLPAP